MCDCMVLAFFWMKCYDIGLYYLGRVVISDQGSGAPNISKTKKV